MELGWPTIIHRWAAFFPLPIITTSMCLLYTIVTVMCASAPRSNAVPVQSTDHAHAEQHATHLHGLTLNPESAATAASCWQPAAGVAVSAVRAIWDPVWQRRLSAARRSSKIQTRRLVRSCPTTPRTNLVPLQVLYVDGVVPFFHFWCYGAPWPLATCSST